MKITTDMGNRLFDLLLTQRSQQWERANAAERLAEAIRAKNTILEVYIRHLEAQLPRDTAIDDQWKIPNEPEEAE